VEVLERENKRWEVVENYQNKMKERDEYSAVNQIMGVKRTANSNGYSPSYPDSPTTPSLSNTTATPKAKD
jgi:hypothetical protein